MNRPLLNFLCFQTGWMACVMGAGRGCPWLGPVLTPALLGLHLALAPSLWQEAAFIGLASLCGTGLDILLTRFGIYSFPGHPGLPLWMFCLWLLFSSTFNSSLAWLKGRYALAALLGAAGGPLSDLAAARLKAIRLPASQASSLLLLSLIWALTLPGLAFLSETMVPGRPSDG